MKKSNFLRFFLSFLMFTFIVGLAATPLKHYGIPPVATVTGAIALTFGAAILSARNKSFGEAGVYKNGVETEFWVNYIIQRLWKDNKFLMQAYSDDQYVVGGKIVHIPQPGSKPTVVKGRSSFPASAVRRTDTDILYALEEYSTDPTHIQDAEKVELSYSKIDSVLGDHAGTINEAVADDMIVKWLQSLPSTNIVETSGAVIASKVAGQTGNRLAMTFNDLKKARLAMNLQNIPGEDRFALIEENMFDELTDSLSATQYKDFSQMYDASTGVVGKLFGFQVMTRSSVAMSAGSLISGNLVVNALGASISATDKVTSICWQKNSVTRALGEVKFFEQTNNPQFYGDVYSALLRMGGRRRRADNAGVIAIRQKESV